jgi:hypothetical protein
MGLLMLYRSYIGLSDLSLLVVIYALIIGVFHMLSSYQLRKVSQEWLQDVLFERV